MAKSIFDRNPLTEMFSSVEEAMRCANSMELNNMLRNSFKGITTDPILGKQNKSKESMSIAIIVGDDSNNLNNINTLENGGKMKKFKYTGRYADGGKKLKPIPADNKGLQALAKKNPKLVIDMGFDPNSVAGKTKGKKKKGPKVPKNQDVLPMEFEPGGTDDPSLIDWESIPRPQPTTMDKVGEGLYRFIFGDFFDSKDPETVAANEAYQKQLMEELKAPFTPINKEIDGGMAPNLGAYPDIVYLTRFGAGGKQRKVTGYQDGNTTIDFGDGYTSDGGTFMGIIDQLPEFGFEYDASTNTYTKPEGSGGVSGEELYNALFEHQENSGLSPFVNAQAGEFYDEMVSGRRQPGTRQTERKIIGGEVESRYDEDLGEYVFTAPRGRYTADGKLYTGRRLGVGDNLEHGYMPEAGLENYFQSTSITGDPNSPYYVKPETYGDIYEGYRYDIHGKDGVDFLDYKRGQELDPAETDMILQARGLDPSGYKDLSNQQIMQAVEEANQYAPGTYQTGSIGGGPGGFFGAHNFEAAQASLDKMAGIERGTDDKYKTGQQRLDAIKGEYDRVNTLADASAGYEEELADIKAMYDAGEITKEQYDRRAGIITAQSASGDPQLQNLPFFREGKSSASSESSASSASSASSSSSREDNKDRSNYPGAVFKSSGLNIRDFQKGEFADRSKESNRELRDRLQEHLAAGGTPETFSVRQTAQTADIEDAKNRLRENITTMPVELPKGQLEKIDPSAYPMSTRSRKEIRQDNRQSNRAANQSNRRANRLERLEGRLETAQQRRDERQSRQDARQQFKGQVQDLKGQIREARRGGDGMYFNPMYFNGGPVMPNVPAGQNIPNGGQMPPAFTFARQGAQVPPQAPVPGQGTLVGNPNQMATSMNDVVTQMRLDVASGKISAQDAANMLAQMFATDQQA